jgi:hypothetical protein
MPEDGPEIPFAVQIWCVVRTPILDSRLKVSHQRSDSVSIRSWPNGSLLPGSRGFPNNLRLRVVAGSEAERFAS